MSQGEREGEGEGEGAGGRGWLGRCVSRLVLLPPLSLGQRGPLGEAVRPQVDSLAPPLLHAPPRRQQLCAVNFAVARRVDAPQIHLEALHARKPHMCTCVKNPVY